MRILRSMALALVLGSAILPFVGEPSRAAVLISVGFAPPPLPVYTQPPIPGPGYLWVPGYWAWDGDDYYWVPGYWSRPPRVGLLWTPGYWGWSEGVYVFHRGYWGSSVGFYGGVPYGFGYTGIGFSGGYWRGRSFYYNRSVTNVGVNITNVYERPVPVMNRGSASYNGGQGGIVARPTPVELAAARKGLPPTDVQMRHATTAAADPTLRSKANQGRPPVAAVPTPGAIGAHALPSHGPAAAGAPAGFVGRPPVAGSPVGGTPAGLIGKPAGAGGPAVTGPGPKKPAVTTPAVRKPPVTATGVQQKRPPTVRSAMPPKPTTVSRPAAVRSAPVRARPTVQPARMQPARVQPARPAAHPQAGPRRRLPGE
jgi:hypothetical protein